MSDLAQQLKNDPRAAEKDMLVRQALGRSVREIATEYGISKTSVHTILQIAKARLEQETQTAADNPPKDPFEEVGRTVGETVPTRQEEPPADSQRGDAGEEKESDGSAREEEDAEAAQDPEESPTEEEQSEAAWPMSQDEMTHLAKMHKASHYEPETWPHWAKKLEFSIDNRACLDMEKLFPDKEHREGVVYEDIMTAIHTGRNSLWKWTGVNLSLVFTQHELFVWCQMDADGKTMEIKFVRHDKR
jgi:predicted transcriptional regulator